MALCGHSSINELVSVNKNKKTSFKYLYSKNEYVPKMHGIRDAIVDTEYSQIEEINKDIIQKAKENKLFRKNTIDGLTAVAWDGVELTETNKNIEGLPEREYESTGEIRKYIKYLVGMQIGPEMNIIVSSRQLLEEEKIKAKNGKEKAKTIGETTAFQRQWKETEKTIGRVTDVHVFDALYLIEPVMTLINNKEKYFVIRMKDETRNIYKDAKGLFNSREADYKYEIVEITEERNIKYSKEAKKKDKIKKKTKKEKRKISNEKLGEKKIISKKVQEKKNSIVKVTVSETVISRKEVWDDEFDYDGYKDKVRVIRSKEKICRDGKTINEELYVVTNMLNHDVETVLKIMHYRWNIENNGFRTLKQRYNIEHIFIGELNAINYIIQMIFMAFNLLELYMKIRLVENVNITWNMLTRIFEIELHSEKAIRDLFNNSG